MYTIGQGYDVVPVLPRCDRRLGSSVGQEVRVKFRSYGGSMSPEQDLSMEEVAIAFPAGVLAQTAGLGPWTAITAQD